MRNLNIHKLTSSLDCLCRKLDYEYNINNGGCCLVSYFIASNLEKLGIKYKLVVYDSYKKDNKEIYQEINSMVQKTTSYTSITGNYTCNHYCLFLIGGGIINNDETDDDEYKYTIDGITSKNIKWIYKYGAWNDVYDIRNNKRIKCIINSFFEKYEKNCIPRNQNYEMS